MRTASEKIAHRGPDDHGCWLSDDGRVALGNRRLAIQDLSPAGHMPMGDAEGRTWITFNGEIYNFKELRVELEQLGQRFQSGSDTEVILGAYRQWGTECLARLNGMFAFAIYDGGRARGGPRLLLARDRAGEKPLYYWQHADGLVFGSELKALMADPILPRRLSLPAFNAFLAFGYVPNDMCILEGVNKLPPAHALTYDINTSGSTVWRYWSLPKGGLCTRPPDRESLVDELSVLLRQSVRQRLIADVPVGVLLSGGIDSSLVTAMAAECSAQPVKTFTITFPGYGEYDEASYARRVAEFFSTDHHEFVASPTSVDLLPKLAYFCDEPLADSSLLPTYIVSQMTRRQVTVALSGDGGDELFGGYDHYSWNLRKQRWLRTLPRPLRSAIASGARHCLPVGLKGRNFLSSIGGDLRENVITESLIFDATARQALVAKPIYHALRESFLQPEAYKSTLWCQDSKPVDQMTRLDFTSYLPDDILAKVDRASMAVSLEVRAPWLDQQVIEFAFMKVPGILKALPDEKKIIPLQLARRLLPPDLNLQRKQGFSLPLSSWFKDGWGDFVVKVLSEADTNLFAQDAIDRLVEGQHRGFSNSSRLFALMMFELWRRHYQVHLG